VIDFFTSLGIPAANIQAPFVAGIEFVCGIAVLLGVFTRLAAVPLMGTMVVAILTAKKADITGFADLMGLNEYAFLLLLLWLSIRGAGAVSLDRLFCRKKADSPS
jgi:putative oxidoreductase